MISALIADLKRCAKQNELDGISDPQARAVAAEQRRVIAILARIVKSASIQINSKKHSNKYGTKR